MNVHRFCDYNIAGQPLRGWINHCNLCNKQDINQKLRKMNETHFKPQLQVHFREKKKSPENTPLNHHEVRLIMQLTHTKKALSIA